MTVLTHKMDKKEQHMVYIGKYIQHSKFALLAGHFLKYMRACVCLGVRVCERERERERAGRIISFKN